MRRLRLSVSLVMGLDSARNSVHWAVGSLVNLNETIESLFKRTGKVEIQKKKEYRLGWYSLSVCGPILYLSNNMKLGFNNWWIGRKIYPYNGQEILLDFHMSINPSSLFLWLSFFSSLGLSARPALSEATYNVRKPTYSRMCNIYTAAVAVGDVKK